MGVPVSWQIGVELARDNAMFLRIVSRAPRAAEPGSSFSMEARKRSSTSFGRLDDVRRISSRISLVKSRIRHLQSEYYHISDWIYFVTFTLITCLFIPPKRYLYSSSPRMKSNS